MVIVMLYGSVGSWIFVEAEGVVDENAKSHAAGDGALELEELEDCMAAWVQLTRLKVLYLQRFVR
jgi:hypothetical protein